MKNAVIYVRVSSEDQAKQFSISIQKRELTALAQSKDYTIRQVYNEGGISGESFNSRPQLLQLLKDAENREFDFLLISSLDRLSRNLPDSIFIRGRLQEAGVTIITLAQEFVHNSIDHDFTANIWGSIDDYERKRILERCQKGREEKRSKGGWLGGHPPKGYQYNPTTKTLETKEDEIEFIRQTYDLALKLSPYKVALEHQSHGYEITPRQVRRMIESKKVLFYSGRVMDYSGNIIKAEWPAIISKDLADNLLLAKRKRRTVAPESTRAKYLLTGLGIFRCRFCGRTVKSFKGRARNDGTKITYYRCSSIQYGESCPNLKMRQIEIINRKVWNFYSMIIMRLKDTNQIVHEFVKSQLDTQKVANLKKSLKDIKKRQERLIFAIEEGIISLDVVSQRFTELKKRENVLQDELRSLSRQNSLEQLDQIKFLAESLDPEIDLSFYEKRQILKLLTDKIELSKKSIYINFALPIIIKNRNSAKIPSTEARIKLI